MVRLPAPAFILLVTFSGACSDSGSPNQLPVPAVPAALRVVSGDDQHGLVGQRLGQPVVLQVVDSTDRPVPDQGIVLEVLSGDGSVSPQTGITDQAGRLQVDWTLGPDPDQRQVVYARLTDLETGAPFLFTTFTATAHPAPTGLHFTDVQAGTLRSCGLTPEGRAYCWGSEPTSGAKNTAPAAVPGDLTFLSLTLGFAHTCGLSFAGAAYCWGQNADGQLGNGTTGDGATPNVVSGGLAFGQIEAGWHHTCALAQEGQAHCWGSNTQGQLGDGTTTNRSTPTRVVGGHSFTAIAAGGSFSCGLIAIGAAYCWGARIGSGSATGDLEPTLIGGGLVFTAITAGANHACAITADGSVYCWGLNAYNELGVEGLRDSRVPVAVSGGLIFSAISAGSSHTCGLVTGGVLACWGWDDQNADSREFNGGVSIHSATPVMVPGGQSFVRLSEGLTHGCGVTAEQTAYCWFDNGNGALGTGDEVGSYQPRPVY